MEQTIRHYKITREIGKGGMGIVYKGLDPKTQKSVAIKILPPNMVDRTTVERFNREAQVMTKLKHPNMIEVYAFGMEKGKHFLVMEFIEGENLKAVIKRKGPLPIKECLDITAQVAEALTYVHDEALIHRDVKPGNIMITKDGGVKVLDFGLVKVLGVTNLTVEGTSLGTAEYMSPEQVSDDGVDLRTDIYSLGVTMYEMLTGRPPFEADSLQSLLMKQKYEAPTPIRKIRPEVPSELEYIVSHAMSKNLAERYQRIAQLLEDINKLRGVQPTERIKKFPVAEKTEVATVHQAPAAAKKASSSAFNPAPLIKMMIFVIVIGLVFHYRDRLLRMTTDVTKIAKGEKALVDEAEVYLRKLEKADGHHRSGLQLYREGSLEKAVKEYQKAIDLREDYAPYYRDLALAFEKQKQDKKAIEAWQNLLKYDQSSADARLARQQIETLTGQ